MRSTRISVKRYHVDREAHEERMDAVAWRKPKAGAWRERFSPDQSDTARHKRPRYLHVLYNGLVARDVIQRHIRSLHTHAKRSGRNARSFDISVA